MRAGIESAEARGDFDGLNSEGRRRLRFRIKKNHQFQSLLQLSIHMRLFRSANPDDYPEPEIFDDLDVDYFKKCFGFDTIDLLYKLIEARMPKLSPPEKPVTALARTFEHPESAEELSDPVAVNLILEDVVVIGSSIDVDDYYEACSAVGSRVDELRAVDTTIVSDSAGVDAECVKAAPIKYSLLECGDTTPARLYGFCPNQLSVYMSDQPDIWKMDSKLAVDSCVMRAAICRSSGRAILKRLNRSLFGISLNTFRVQLMFYYYFNICRIPPDISGNLALSHDVGPHRFSLIRWLSSFSPPS